MFEEPAVFARYHCLLHDLGYFAQGDVDTVLVVERSDQGRAVRSIHA